MTDESKPQGQDPQGSPTDRNDPAIAPANQPLDPNQTGGQAQTSEPESADPAIDQKNHHNDNSNEFSPGFKPNPDRPAPSDDTDADIDTDGG